MSITPGVRLGPYEITGAIGASGMGRYPVWSRDSARVTFQSDREGDQGDLLATRGWRRTGRAAHQATGAVRSQELHIVLNWVEELKRLVPVK